MKGLIALLIFCLVLFIYLHVYFHLKTSNDLEVYEIEQPSKDKLEEICDLRQPVIFNYYNERLIDSCNRSSINDTYGAYRIYPFSITGSPDKSLNIKNHEKLFIKYFNRKKNIYDKIISKIFYFIDRLLNPIVLFYRISDLIKSKKNIKVD